MKDASAPGTAGPGRPLRVALYGEINLNLIDGSSVWLQSVAQMLTTLPGVEVTLLERFPERRDILSAPLHEHPRIELVDPSGFTDSSDPAALAPEQALDALERLDSEQGFDLVVLRGAAVSKLAASRGSFPGRLWVYYLPQQEADDLPLIAEAAERVLCQTEPIRALAEAAVPAHAAKLILLPPMIPGAGAGASGARPTRESRGEGPLRLLYAGKFAPEYSFLEMVETFRRLRRSRPDAELHLVGDKIHDPPQDPAFKPAAEAALAGTEGVVWHGGVPRERVAELLAEADVALSVRHPMMARSRELSTKVLEYGAAGCAVLLNRTPLYEQLLGADYPLFAEDADEALAGLKRLADEPELRGQAAERCAAAAERHGFERVAAGIALYLGESGPGEGGGAHAEGPRPHLLFAGHDLKFLMQIPGRARAAGAEMRQDHWSAHNVHDPKASRELLEWADVVMCEWCLGNAVWYSANVREDQRLVVRYHRMERETDYPESVAIDRVDSMVFVGRHLLDEAAERFSWPEEKLRVVPNAIDVHALRREKLPGSEFNLALLGFVPARKRLDRALDVLELLRARDERYRLIVKGQPPWAYSWIMRREEERLHFEEVYRRLKSAPLLRGAVSFEEFSPNVPAFLRKVGIILSTAEHEGHQVALAEGMASGSLPVVIDRPGAREQYSDRWVHETPDRAAQSILELAAREGLGAEQRLAADYAERWSVERIMPLWDDALGLPQPRRGAASVPGQAAG